MKNKRNGNDENEVRMELKYCEHCGGLWLRECGAGVVYCDNCTAQVAELPVRKKRPRRVLLPVRRHAVVDDYEYIDDSQDFEAAGGVA